MRIALVRKNFTSFGGAENYLRLIAGKLSDQGHEIEIFSAAEGSGDKFSVRKVNACRKPSFLSNIMFASRAKEALQKVSPDFILSFERTLYQDVYRAGDGCHKEWLKRRGIIDSPLKQFTFKINPHHLTLLNLERRCYQSSRYIVANSNMVKDDIIRNYPVSPDKIHVIYNGVETSGFKPADNEKKKALRRSYQLKEDNIILFIGADFKRKGVSFLLKSFSLVDLNNTRLIIAGRPAKTEYISMTEQLDIDKKVTFWGPEKDVGNLYAVSDVFVLPTIYDPFSNATLEAMASGLPVITTQYNGASEIIEDGVQGFIVDPQDTKLLSERITSALADCEKMGKSARAKAEEYSIDNAVNSIVGLISGKEGSHVYREIEK
jgi:UDP-glucose:(heptosyl)LPS alpha-1,3-glucosyltransferase